METEEEESKSGFLIKNLVRGLIGFVVIITAFILLESYIEEHFLTHINTIQSNPFLFYGIFTLSEIIFGIIPPEFFMLVYVFNHVPLSEYVLNLSILTIISYFAGVLGFYIGKNFSKTAAFAKIELKYLSRYGRQIRRFGGYLVFVGAVTPIPFSATCMLAGSVNFSFKTFLLICIARILRFAVYGWMVWSFPNFFNG
jgi:membrane protein YqaA with SNARE-associated domain